MSSPLTGVRAAFACFLLSGILLSLPGAILPSWGAHRESNYQDVGFCFLALLAGLLLAAGASTWMLRTQGPRKTMLLGCGLGALSLAYLALVPPPRSDLWRLAGMFAAGAASGLLHGAGFRGLSEAYRRDAAGTVNTAGILFGFGCVATAALLAVTFDRLPLGQALLVLAAAPLGVAYASWRGEESHTELLWQQEDVRQHLRSPRAVLFSVLLFLQFAAEWSIAGWLPLFLIQRLGAAPVWALNLLAVYWMALLAGRLVIQVLLPRVRHGRLLVASGFAAMCGCLILAVTNNRFGATLAVLLAGAGFSAVYPLLVEKIGLRFPSYHPGLFNGLFSVGLSAGLAGPFAASLLVEWFGLAFAMLIPLVGSVLVFLTLLLLNAEDQSWRLRPTRGTG